MNKVVILGIFYSGYKDVWHDFVNLFKQNWPNCPFDLYIVADTDGVDSFEGLPVINCGIDSEYSNKIQTAIKNIDADYYLILLEDFFFGSTVSDEKVSTIIDFIVENKINYYSMPMPDFSNNYKGKRIDKKRREISSKADYTLSCQPSFWKKDFLKVAIGTSNYNAWVFEGIYRKSKKAHSAVFLKGCVADLSNPLNLRHGVLQGCFIPDTLKYFHEKKYTFISKRDVLSHKEYKKNKLKIFLRGIMPYKLQRIVRRVFKRKSIVNKYDSIIDERIKEMGL